MTKKPVDKIFSEAVDASRRLRNLPKVKIVSDPDDSMKDVIRIMENVYGQIVAFRQGEEQTAGALGAAFRPGTDLGDLISLFHSLDDEREQAGIRFAQRRRRPIHSARWMSFQREFEGEIRSRGRLQKKSRDAVIQDVIRSASVLAARVLVEGWRTSKPRGKGAKEKAPRMGRKPAEKIVDLGSGFSLILREVTPPEIVDLLRGDAATLGDRILQAALVGAGAYLPMNPSEKEDFLRGAFFSPTELDLLLREARAFLVECVRNGRGAALAELGRVATANLSGGRTRREMVDARRSQPEDVLAGNITEAVFDGMEAILEREVEAPSVRDRHRAKLLEMLNLLDDKRLTDRDRVIVRARLAGKKWKEIAFDLGTTDAAARKEFSRTRRK